MSKRTSVVYPSALVFLATVVAAAYWPGLYGGFVLDDFPNIIANDAMKLDGLSPGELLRAALSSDSGPLNRPLAMLSLSLERYFAGLDPFVMKATNVAIHVINAFLLFLLLRSLASWHEDRQARPFLVPTALFAFAVAIAWALAPINLTGVLYVIQRMESLASLFILAGLLAYVRGRRRLARGQPGALRWLWCGLVGGGILGLTAKETAVMLPVYAVLIEWFFFGFGRQDSLERGALLRLFGVVLVLPAALGLVWLLPRIHGGGGFEGRPFDMVERLWTQGRVLWHYLYWIVAPNTGNLSLYHDALTISRGPLTPWTTLPAAAGLVGLVALAVTIRRRLAWVGFGILWFFVPHVLVSTILGLELVHEHRNYLASAGVLTAVFALLLDGREPALASTRRFALVALIVVYGVTTAIRASEWSDPLRLAYFEAKRNPESPRALNAFGHLAAQSSEGPGSPRFSTGIAQLKDAAELPQSSLAPLKNLIVHHARHDLPVDRSWWHAMEDHVRTQPLTTQDRNTLVRLIRSPREQDLALSVERLGELVDTAVATRPDDALLVTLKANFLLNVAGDIAAAQGPLQRAVALKPRDPDKWNNLVEYQITTGRLERAQAGLERLQALNRFGRHDEAIGQLGRRLNARQAAGDGVSER
ncbi:MAG: tetratricopeptide repeat protein [Spiribacter salinus]|uniref:Tetratricopeptide repeat protein n=1 Tax=Spiribacter salinus TaxID=1335746 RepID=A0A540VNX5_9GAMM|nr:MAG: tetratricopeptide repeat protein [Spiribacter salinus]